MFANLNEIDMKYNENMHYYTFTVMLYTMLLENVH